MIKKWDGLPIYSNRLTLKTANHQIIGTAMIISILTLVCQLVAFVKEMWVAAWFGTSDKLDAFLMAMVIPTFLINVIAGPFQSALIPGYIYVRNNLGSKEAQNLFSNITAYSLLIIISIIFIIAFFAPIFLPIMASGFHATKLDLTQKYFYCLLPIILIQGIVILWSTVLNAYNRFFIAAFVPVFLPLSIIGTLLTIGKKLNVFSLVIGTLIGITIQSIILGWEVKHLGIKVLPRWDLKNKYAKGLIRQWVHLAGGAFLMGCTNLVDQSMAAMLDSGSVSALNYGSRIVNVGLGLTAASISTAIFPFFSEKVVAKEWKALWETIHFYLRWIFIISLPISFLIFTFSPQIIRLFYERGAFLSKDTYIVANIQSFFVWQVPFYIGGMVLTKIISSLRINQILIWVSGFNLIFKIIMNFWLIQWIGVNGIALSTSLMYLGSFILVYYFVRIHFLKLMKEY